MATADYSDYTTRYPESTASAETVRARLDDVAAERAARCIARGTTYENLVSKSEPLVRRIECDSVYRMCGRPSVGGVQQNGLSSFSQSVGDHRWEYGYASGNGKNLLLDDEWKALGLSGQQIGWLGVPYSGESDG